MFANSEYPQAFTNMKNRAVYSSRNYWSGVFFGIGTMAFVDEVIFHQLLQWHHFYDLSTRQAGIFADGLLNAFAWFVGIGALFLFSDLRRRNALWPKRWVGAVFLGAGGFQLFDGIVMHKVLRLHQIRYGVDILPYDLTWNIGGGILLLTGLVILKQTRKPARKMKEGK
ncbi:MAG TPA: DUF2243 domain-containing protein [Planococcus sp. (in: firmicutes)]|nr:DUF2243 domain-containing protein [Planococcus sp. (in: firmicutes)]